MLVSTKLGNSSAWYNNILYKVEDSKLTLSLKDSYLENTIVLNSHFNIKFTNEFFEYIFEGIVIEINPIPPSYVKVLIKKADELVNTRFFPRYDTYIASTLKMLWNDNLYFSIVNNICLGGMAFVCDHEMDYGEEAEVCVYIPDIETICTRGKVIRKSHKNNLFSYSMQFIQMDEANSIRLSNYLTSIDEQNSNLIDFYFKNIKDKLKK